MMPIPDWPVVGDPTGATCSKRFKQQLKLQVSKLRHTLSTCSALMQAVSWRTTVVTSASMRASAAPAVHKTNHVNKCMIKRRTLTSTSTSATASVQQRHATTPCLRQSQTKKGLIDMWTTGSCRHSLHIPPVATAPRPAASRRD